MRDALDWTINPFTVEQAILKPRLVAHLERQRAIIEDDPTTARMLKAIRDEASRLGAKTACVLIPASFQVQPSAVVALRRFGYEADGALVEGADLLRSVTGILKELGVPTLDLTPTLKNLPDEPYYPLDGHLSPAGHRASAKAIDDFLADSGLLSGTPR
jgi:hypothetical protein